MEQQLRKEKYKHELNVESLIARYDEDMTKKQDELDEVTQLYEEESRQLKELEEKFKPLEEEYLKVLIILFIPVEFYKFLSIQRLWKIDVCWLT